MLYAGDECFEQLVWNQWKTVIGSTTTTRALSDLAAMYMCTMN
jgi:ribulose bisphosphate carboxylase small subunit